MPRQTGTRTTAGSCRGVRSRSIPRATGDGREIPKSCSQEPRWPRRKAQDLGHHQEHHEPAVRVDRSQPPGGAGSGTGDGASAIAVERSRSWLIRLRLVKPEHEPSHPAATRSGSSRGSGTITGHYSGLYFVLWPARSEASPSLRSATYELSDSDSNVLRSPDRPTGDRGLRAHKARRISAKAR